LLLWIEWNYPSGQPASDEVVPVTVLNWPGALELRRAPATSRKHSLMIRRLSDIQRSNIQKSKPTGTVVYDRRWACNFNRKRRKKP
jgi:hypothetical protein